MVFNGNQRYGYSYIVRHKKPVGDQEVEGYKIMRAVTLGTGRKLLKASGARLVRPLPAILSVLTPARKSIHEVWVPTSLPIHPQNPTCLLPTPRDSSSPWARSAHGHPSLAPQVSLLPCLLPKSQLPNPALKMKPRSPNPCNPMTSGQLL